MKTRISIIALLLSTSVGHVQPFFFDQHRHTYEVVPAATTFEKKEYTVAVYIAARNDLARFVTQNLQEMMQVGTNEHLTILVHLDSVLKNNTMVTQRFIIYKNKIVQVGETVAMDSGKPETLVDFCRWAFTNFPCKQPILTLWSHGIGDLEIDQWIRMTHFPQLYITDPQTKLIEINRDVTYSEYLMSLNQQNNAIRGICFDDITGHVLTNHDVNEALTIARDKYLGGQPFACILCDACLMNSIGFIFSLKPYSKKPVARLLLGSQESVLATGYDYYRTLLPLSKGAMPLADFAKHVVQVFSDTYRPIIRDYTHSAIALDHLDPLYESIDEIARLLIFGLTHQKSQSVESFIDTCSSRNKCTYFAEPTYKDMHHLFSNMSAQVANIVLQDVQETKTFRTELAQHLHNACALIQQVVIANATGSNLSKATGISIYLPKKRSGVHHSYQDTDFGKHSVWFDFVKQYATR